MIAVGEYRDERTVVVVEDDPNIADLSTCTCAAPASASLQAATGERGLELIDQHRPAIVLLDIGLPDIDGFEVCRRIRATSTVPVLFLTARDGEIDRVLGLELGADDYVTKPFSPREVVARVKAILRRGQPHRRGGDGARRRRRASRSTSPGARSGHTARRSPLATREFDLLAFFARNQGIALSRQQLLDGVWGADWYGDERTVDVHVRQLRKKLGDDLPLATVWGIGYRLG